MNKIKESWKDIPGYDGKYQADMQGNIQRVYRSGKTHRMTPYHKKMSGSQRLVVKLTRDGKSREEIVMQLVAKTFLGSCPEGCVPYHRNGCQSDNYMNNICYISRKELGKKTGEMMRQCCLSANTGGTGKGESARTVHSGADAKHAYRNRTDRSIKVCVRRKNMRVVDEHECKHLEKQNMFDENEIAVQFMVQDTKKGVKKRGWYHVFYTEQGNKGDVALGIRCCPYCGKKLKKDN